MSAIMSDERHVGPRHSVVPNDDAVSTTAGRARRGLGSSRASDPSADVRRQKGARAFVGIDRKALYTFPVPAVRLLEEYFKLTPAEARLAQLMARAASVEDASRRLGVKLCTARSQLAAIFEKTATARQAELVVLLSRMAHLSQPLVSRAAS